MTKLYTLIVAASLSALPAGAALAQVDRTGTGDGPLATEKAPNTTAVGQTKPPGHDAGSTSVTPVERRAPRWRADDAIRTRVCVGCDPGAGATGAAPETIAGAGLPERRDARPDEPRAAAEPKQQPDLDTLALASAHREQAKSMEEKTNGLWQSWVVSVCEGCGDQKPARALTLQDWPNRDVSMTTGSVEHGPAPGTARPAGAKDARRADVHPRGSLEADLSPANLNSIRRMPQE